MNIKFFKRYIFLFVFFLLGIEAVALAQESQEGTPEKSEKETALEVQADLETANRLKALEQNLEKQEQRVLSLEKRSETAEEKAYELGLKLEEAQEETAELLGMFFEATSVETERKLSIYGFMDTNFSMVFPGGIGRNSGNWDNPIFIKTSRKTTFYQNNVNLFFHSELSPKAEALVETRFTFQPSGNVRSYPRTVYFGDTPVFQDGEYLRDDTTVTNVYSGSFRLGGVAIERAYFDWKPRDWLKIRFGRYITPFGIWNEDHGSPVLLTTTPPFIISHNYLPNRQTGLMLFGSLFPTANIDLEYALTLSNGRGPTDEYLDLDNNKALGLRLKLNYTKDDFGLSLGTYGYLGKYTDSINRMHVYINEDGVGLRDDIDTKVAYREEVVKKYRELLFSADVSLSYKGLRLFGEYAFGKINFLTPTKIDVFKPLLIGSDTSIDAVEADFIKRAMYVMLAYELPLKLKSNLKITPFVGFDYLLPHDVYDYESLYMVQFGINFKPTAYVSLKTNVYSVIPASDDPIITDNTWYWVNMIAVSF